MRNPQEVIELKEELSKLTAFITDFGLEEEFRDKDVQFSCDITDTLSWVLEEISSEDFRSDSYINFLHLKEIASTIEKRTGNKLQDYK
jgi:hypothetical protein